MAAPTNWNNPPHPQREKVVMRTLVLAFLVACAPVLAQTNYGTITFTNKSGDVISNAVVTKVVAGKLTYRYSDAVGGGVVRLADLPEGLRARFGDSPDRADNAAALQRPAQPTEADRKKFEETKAKAEKGDARAQCLLAKCYYVGSGVTEDAVEAVKWWSKAAENGDAEAMVQLGAIYTLGKGVPTNTTEGERWNMKAADLGNVHAMTALGDIFLLKGEAEVKRFTVDSLGRWVFDTPNSKLYSGQAAGWYRKAAELGDTNAMWHLTDLSNVEESERTRWTRKLAEAGDVREMMSLGFCYIHGQGTETNVDEGLKWFRKAAEQGDQLAQSELEALGQTDADRKFFEKTKAKAEKGDAQAQCLLAKCYYVGSGVTQDKVEGARWFRKAAEQGFAEAQGELGDCYRRGDGVSKDAVEGAKWLRKAAEQGYAQAQCQLGECYYMGQGVTADNVEALKWYRKAAAQGVAKAEALANLIEPNALAQAPAKASASRSRPDLETLSLTTKVMETNDTWWRWSYQLKVRNKTDQPIHEFPHLLFLDAEGFIIHKTTCEVKLYARETKTVLGTTLVELPGAARVKTVKVE